MTEYYPELCPLNDGTSKRDIAKCVNCVYTHTIKFGNISFCRAESYRKEEMEELVHLK